MRTNKNSRKSTGPKIKQHMLTKKIMTMGMQKITNWYSLEPTAPTKKSLVADIMTMQEINEQRLITTTLITTTQQQGAWLFNSVVYQLRTDAIASLFRDIMLFNFILLAVSIQISHGLWHSSELLKKLQDAVFESRRIDLYRFILLIWRGTLEEIS